jgi:uncharacterized protein YdhG (YjbR/CyaY superfamily)
MRRNDRDPRVDVYIEALPVWQQAICRKVRTLAHAADQELLETIKRTRQPYFTLRGNVCALLAAKNWVNVFLYDGAIVPDPQGIITSGHDNKTARTVTIRQGEKINAPALATMFRQIIANNRAGGWRKLIRVKANGPTGPKPKIKGKTKTIDEYLAALSNDKRVALERLRRTIRAAAPRAEECISYQLPAFRLDGRMLVWFGASANHCAFYPGAVVQAHQDELKDYDISKGTIRFQAHSPLPATLVRKLVKTRIGRNAAQQRHAADGASRRR